MTIKLEELIGNEKICTNYPIVICNEEGKSIFAVMNKPEVKYFLKGKEITIEKLIELLNNIDY